MCYSAFRYEFKMIEKNEKEEEETNCHLAVDITVKTGQSDFCDSAQEVSLYYYNQKQNIPFWNIDLFAMLFGCAFSHAFGLSDNKFFKSIKCLMMIAVWQNRIQSLFHTEMRMRMWRVYSIKQE